ncbi:hypothetical protein B0T16DRAFT_460181 [Cercophora newfieldiana]|uniref:Uncharacterized protein n=1 Tax=Cercophora newfieldiana TaxID=92897 RepID=A0AA39Y3A2_9PEZI|nr:hypothetical protein B0T16DRAFT_460181 [Cercophora newfieldiana]
MSRREHRERSSSHPERRESQSDARSSRQKHSRSSAARGNESSTGASHRNSSHHGRSSVQESAHAKYDEKFILRQTQDRGNDAFVRSKHRRSEPWMWKEEIPECDNRESEYSEGEGGGEKADHDRETTEFRRNGMSKSSRFLAWSAGLHNGTVKKKTKDANGNPLPVPSFLHYAAGVRAGPARRSSRRSSSIEAAASSESTHEKQHQPPQGGSDEESDVPREHESAGGNRPFIDSYNREDGVIEDGYL